MIFTKPAEIEQESMRIIAAELEARGIVIPEEERAVVMRVIHTTADFDYAANLRFTPGAVSLGRAALRGGVIVTDTNMALAGINKAASGRLGCTVRCTMAEDFIAERARERGVTRSIAPAPSSRSGTPRPPCCVSRSTWRTVSDPRS